MVMLALVAGFNGGLTGSFVKTFTIQCSIDGHLTVTAVVFFLLAALSATSQIFMLNKAMEFYDQIEVIPIYNTLLIFMNMFCGAVILDEYKMYTI